MLGNRHPYRDRLLAYVTGLVNQELLLQNEYLAAENRILRAHLPARLCLSDPERSMLAEIGKRLGRKVSDERPTIGGWLCDLETQGIADLVGLDGLRASRILPTRFGS